LPDVSSLKLAVWDSLEPRFGFLPLIFGVFVSFNSWTLRADLICNFVCRLINYMDEYGLDQATPVMEGEVEERPFADFSSGYFQRAAHLLPKQTTRAPWKQNQSYAHDLMDLRFGAIEDGALKFTRKPASPAPTTQAKREAAPVV
jgi:hypothetical protein